MVALAFELLDGVAPYQVNGLSFNNANILLESLQSGILTLDIADSRGCAITQNITVPQQTSNLLLHLEAAYPTSCMAMEGALKVSVSGGVAPYHFEWLGRGVFSDSLGGLSSGSYAVVVRDANGCSQTASYVVGASGGISNVSWNIVAPSCALNNGGIEVTSVMGGAAPYAVELISNTGRETIGSVLAETNIAVTDLKAGLYDLLFTDQNNCVFLVSGIQLVDDDAALPTFHPRILVESACGQPTGTAEVLPADLSQDYSYQWRDALNNNLSITTSRAEGLAAGSYSVLVTDESGCEQMVAIQMVDGADPTILLEEVVSSPGGSNGGLIRVNMTGGSGAPYTYLLGNQSSTDGIFANLAPGSYLVSGTDSLGCSSETLDINVSATTGLSLSLVSHTPATCPSAQDGSILLSASGGRPPYSFRIDGKPTANPISNVSATAHVITVKDSLQSVQTLQTNARVLSPLSVGSYVSSVSCNNGSDGTITLDITGGSGSYQVSWLHGASGETLSNLSAGTYTYTMKDARNSLCSVTGSVLVDERSTLEVSLKENIAPLCTGGNNGSLKVSGSGGSGSYRYLWSNGNTTPSVNGLSAGTYTVTVTDKAFECTVAASYTIVDPAQISVSSTVFKPTCGGSNGSVSLSITNASSPLVRWADGQIGTTARNLSSGTHAYTITSSQGCKLSGEVVLGERDALQVLVTTKNNLCFAGCNGEIDLAVSGGTPPYVVQWQGGGSNLHREKLCQGNYAFTVRDFYGCQYQGTVTIGQPDALVISDGTITNISCNAGENGVIAPVISGGVSPYTYLWPDGSKGATLNAVKAGKYELKVVDANGCQTKKTFVLTQPDPMGISSTNISHPSCTGSSDGEVSIAALGGTSPYVVTWNNGLTGAKVKGLKAGKYSYVLTDANGCTINRNVTLIDPAGLQLANVKVVNPVCFDDETGAISFDVLGGSGTYSYLWSNEATSKDLANVPYGDYSLIVNDANGCAINQTFAIVNPPALIVRGIPEYHVACEGGQVLLSTQQKWVSYSWEGPNDLVSTERSVNATEEGEYKVTVTDEKGCEATAKTYVEISANALVADFLRISEAVTFEPIVFIDLSLPIPETIRWVIPDDPSISVNETGVVSMELMFTEAGKYDIGVVVGLGNCVSEITKKITVAENASVGSKEVASARKDFVEVIVSPNPTEGQVRLILNASSRNPLTVHLMTIDNQVLKSTILEGAKDYLVDWDFSNQPAGVYILSYTQGDFVQTKRIMILK